MRFVHRAARSPSQSKLLKQLHDQITNLGIDPRFIPDREFDAANLAEFLIHGIKQDGVTAMSQADRVEWFNQQAKKFSGQKVLITRFKRENTQVLGQVVYLTVRPAGCEDSILKLPSSPFLARIKFLSKVPKNPEYIKIDLITLVSDNQKLDSA